MPSSSPSRYQRIFLGLILFIAFVLLLGKIGIVVGAILLTGDGASEGITNQTLGVSKHQ